MGSPQVPGAGYQVPGQDGSLGGGLPPQGGAGASVPPMPGGGATTGGGGPQVYYMNGGVGFQNAAGSAMSPAVAYAIQQGGVDNRALGKPPVYEPNSNKVSFQDWSDHVITVCDGAMPGIFEVMEWVVNNQPRRSLDAGVLKATFPGIDGLLIDYAESNVYAILSTYTTGEARSLVRQARRPHGMETWSLLQMRFNPLTVGRQRARLIKITNPTENVPLEKLGAEVVAWENRICDFESTLSFVWNSMRSRWIEVESSRMNALERQDLGKRAVSKDWLSAAMFSWSRLTFASTD